MVYRSPVLGGINLSWETLMNMELDERDTIEEALTYLREKEIEAKEAAIAEAERNANK